MMFTEFKGKPLSYYLLEGSYEEIEELREIYKEYKDNPIFDEIKLLEHRKTRMEKLEEENLNLREKLKDINDILKEE